MTALRATAEARLATLRAELATGRTAAQELERRRALLAETVLRIEGAVQVLEELLAAHEPAPASADGAPEEPLCPNPNAPERMSSP